MSFTFTETPDSRQETWEPPAYTLIYKAAGETDDYTVSQYAYLLTASSVMRPYGILYRKDIRIDPDGWGQYLVTVPYGKLDKKSTPTGSASFNFSTKGATVNIKAAKQHVATYPYTEQNHAGAIGVKRSSDGSFDVEGADIVIPALSLTYAFKHPQGIVTESFARILASYTGMTNSAAFRGFAAGELLFVGATGSDGTDAEATVEYEFVASANQSSLTIGDITSIAKAGHDIIWIEFEDDVSSGSPIHKPRAVHVDRCYDSFAFASIFGWS